MQRKKIDDIKFAEYSELLGAPFDVFLAHGIKHGQDTKTGKKFVEIVDLPGLYAAIVQSRVENPRKLSSDELKFLRSALGLKGKDIASVLDMSAEHYSRCENGSKVLSASSEKVLRLYLYFAALFKDTSLVGAESNENSRKCADDASANGAKKFVDAFSRKFLSMKLNSVFEAGDRLSLFFSRCQRDESGAIFDCDDEGSWVTEEAA